MNVILDELSPLFLLQGLFWLSAIVRVLHFCPHAWWMSVPLIAFVGRPYVLHVITQLRPSQNPFTPLSPLIAQQCASSSLFFMHNLGCVRGTILL